MFGRNEYSDSDSDYETDEELETSGATPNNDVSDRVTRSISRSQSGSTSSSPASPGSRSRPRSYYTLSSSESEEEPEMAETNEQPPEQNVDVGDRGEDFDHYEEQREFTSLEPREWHEGLALDPCVGGVHMGKIPLKLYSEDIEDDETDSGSSGGRRRRLNLRRARIGMLIQSGQVYIPFFKKISQKMGISKLGIMGALPAMVTNLMLPSVIHKSTKEEKKIIDGLISELNYIDRLVQEETRITEGNNCVRMEFFYSSTLSSQEPDWDFPKIVPWEFCSLSQQNSYFNAYAAVSSEVNKVLNKSIFQQSVCNYDRLAVDAKRMIILCSELAVSLTEFLMFRPKAMEQINTLCRNLPQLQHASPRNEVEDGGDTMQQEEIEMADNNNDFTDDNHNLGINENQTMEQANNNNDQDDNTVPSVDDTDNITSRQIFNVPSKYLSDLDEQTMMATGLLRGLKAVILPLPKFSPTTQLQYDDMQRRNKDYIQGFLNKSTNQISLMNHYTYVVGRVLALFWTHSDPSSDPTKHSLVELPDFKKLAGLSTAKKGSLLDELTKILANTYDFEWWWIVKNKTNHFASTTGKKLSIGKAHSFPKTKKELEQLLRSDDDLRVSRRYSRKVTSVGK